MDQLNFEIDSRIEYARTLPASTYIEEQYARLEAKRIFGRSWQLAARIDQLPEAGSYLTAEIGGEPIVIVRGADGEIRGFINICRHRAGPLASGSGTCDRLRCGYHGWTYDLKGRLIGLPDFAGVADFDRRDNGLVEVEVAGWEQFIFVRLPGVDVSSRPIMAGPTLMEMLGDIPELTVNCRMSDKKFAERREYVIDCNWKVYVDNYVEGYHVPIIHPRLMKEIDYQRYRTVTSRYHSLQDAPIRSVSDPTRHYSATESQSDALYFWIFPNLMINIYPDNFSTNLILPLGPPGTNRTLTIFEWFFDETESESARRRISAAVELSDEIQREDIAICEAVQRRLGSEYYNRGRYSPERENGLHHFHSLWEEWMRLESTGVTR